jgi:hypothetical protein
MTFLVYIIGLCITALIMQVMPFSAYLSLGILSALFLSYLQYPRFSKRIENKWSYLIVFVLDFLLFPAAILLNIHEAFFSSREQDG